MIANKIATDLFRKPTQKIPRNLKQTVATERQERKVLPIIIKRVQTGMAFVFSRAIKQFSVWIQNKNPQSENIIKLQQKQHQRL